jgi:hypothetical protein
MSNGKEIYEMIPVDDVSLYYQDASEAVRRAVSLLLRLNERFFVYTAKSDGETAQTACVLDEESYGDMVYNVFFDYIERYGHLRFFGILLEFLDSHTHPVTASMLYDMLGEHLTGLDEQGSVEPMSEDDSDIEGSGD